MKAAFVLIALLGAADPRAAAAADTQAGDAKIREQRKHDEERKAEAAARAVLAAMCGGRCELVEVIADVSVSRSMKDALPGFESLGKEEIESELRGVSLAIAVDAKLTPNARAGLSAALKNVAGGAPVTVTYRASEWPTPRQDAPIVVQVNTADTTKKDASPPPRPPAPSEDDDLNARFWRRMIDASPWLFGLCLLLFGSFALAAIAGRALGDALARRSKEPSTTPAPEPKPDTKEPSATESAFLRRLAGNRALRAHVTRLVLERLAPLPAARAIACLGDAVLEDFAETSFSEQIRLVYAELRTERPSKDSRQRALADLERLGLEAERDGLHDPRLWRLHCVSGDTLALVAAAVPLDTRVVLLAHLPSAQRMGYLAMCDDATRAALFSAGFGRRSDLLLDDTAVQDILRLCEAKERAGRHLDALVEDLVALSALGDDGQRLVDSLCQQNPAWATILAEAVVKDEDLATASDDVIDRLVFSVTPEQLADYVQCAGDTVRARLLPRLPAYVSDALREAGEVRPEAARVARAALHAAMRKLRARAGSRARLAALGLLSELDAQAAALGLVKLASSPPRVVK